MSNTSQAIAARRNQQQGEGLTVRERVERMSGEFSKVLPASISAETFVRLALTELRKKPELQQCSEASLMGALMTSAALGLEPGGPLGQFHLTPKRLKGDWQVVPIIGYKGLRDIALRSGTVDSIQSFVVREGDAFGFGANEQRGAWFEWQPLDIDSERPLMGVLTIARLHGTAAPVWRYLSKQQIDKRMNAGAAKGSGFWEKWPEEMARKTGVRAISSDLPTSSVLALATSVDETVQVWRSGDDAPRAAAQEIDAAPTEPEEPAEEDVDKSTGEVRGKTTPGPDVPTEEPPEPDDGFFEPKG